MVFHNMLGKSVSPSRENNNMDELSLKFLKAAKTRDPEALKECIEKGVDIDVQYIEEGVIDIDVQYIEEGVIDIDVEHTEHLNSALHYVLSDEKFRKKDKEKGQMCLEILLENGANPNLRNSLHKIPLDLVVENRVPEAMAELLISHGASFVGPNGIQNSGLAKKLVHKMPGVVKATLDQAVTFTSKAPTDIRSNIFFCERHKTSGRQTPTIEIDWRYIVYNTEAAKTKENPNFHETKFLHDVLSGGTDSQKTILPHPVVQAFLRLKHPLYWRHFGFYYFVWIILTFALYLSFIWVLYSDTCRYHKFESSTTPGSQSSTPSPFDDLNGEFECSSDTGLTVLAYVILLLYTTGPFWLELRRFLAIGPNLYVREWKNYVTIIAAVIVAGTLWPALSLKDSYTLSWQYPVAALGMLVGSLVILIQLSPIVVAALYLEMVFKIFRRIVLATIIISPILLGFFFAFRILLTNEKIGPFKLLTMVVSDNDYEGMMDSDRGVFYNIISYAFFTGFIVLVIIVVLNFLVGLAVSDIQELKESAKSANSISQVRSFYLMDAVYGKLWKYNSIIQCGTELTFRFCPLDETDHRLPEKLKMELLEIARNRCDHQVETEKEDTDAKTSSKLKLRESTCIEIKA